MFRAKKRARAHLDITFQVDVFRAINLRDHFVYDRFICVKFCAAKLRIRFAHAKNFRIFGRQATGLSIQTSKLRFGLPAWKEIFLRPFLSLRSIVGWK